MSASSSSSELRARVSLAADSIRDGLPPVSIRDLVTNIGVSELERMFTRRGVRLEFNALWIRDDYACGDLVFFQPAFGIGRFGVVESIERGNVNRYRVKCTSHHVFAEAAYLTPAARCPTCQADRKAWKAEEIDKACLECHRVKVCEHCRDPHGILCASRRAHAARVLQRWWNEWYYAPEGAGARKAIAHAALLVR